MKAAQPDAALYPWRLEPKLAFAIWGGGELVRDYGKHGDPHAKIGESWECWDTDAVINGALRGSTIAILRERLGAELLGDLDPTQIFPVLTKIITAHDALGAGAPERCVCTTSSPQKLGSSFDRRVRLS